MRRFRAPLLACALFSTLVAGLALASSASAALTLTMSNNGSNLRAHYAWSAPDVPTSTPSLVLTYQSGGLATVGSTWTFGLGTGTETTSTANINFNPASPANFLCTGTCVRTVSSSTGLSNLVEGTYSVVMTFSKTGGVSTSAPSVVTWDSATLAPTLTTPVSSSAGGVSGLAVSYSLPEAALAGSVSLTFVPTGVCSGGTVALTMGNSQTVSTTINPANPTGSGSVAAVSGAFAAGCTYNITLSYQDAQAHAAETATATSVTIPGLPGAPTAPSATGGAGSATVSWTAPAENGSPITSYTVTASNAATCTAAAPATSCVVSGLPVGASYTFTVTATNGSGTGSPSVATAPVLVVGPPAAPTAVTGTPGVRQATVGWTAGADNGSAITGYTVTAAPGGATCTAVAPATSCAVNGLAAGGTYSFTVIAANAEGAGAASAASADMTLPNVPDAPAAPAATAGVGQAVVSWSAPAANGSAVTAYTVTAAPGGATCGAAAPATTCVVPGLAAGQTYAFTVAATNAVGAGAASLASSDVTLPNVPGAAGGLAGVAGDARITASWSAAAANGAPVTGYVVTATPGGATCSTTAPATTCALTGLVNGRAYTFSVVATNAVGPGAVSTSSSGVTPFAAPVDPTSDPPAQPVPPVTAPVVTPPSGTPELQVDAPVPAAPTPATPKTPIRKITLRVGKSVTASAVAKFMGLARPKGSMLRVALAKSSSKICRVTKSKSVWRVHGKKVGQCKLTVTLTLKSGKKQALKVTVPVLKKN